MKRISKTLPLAALVAAGMLAGCTTTGTGVGDSRVPGMSATFSWRAQGARTGQMTAQLSNGANYTGTFLGRLGPGRPVSRLARRLGWPVGRRLGRLGLLGPVAGFHDALFG